MWIIYGLSAGVVLGFYDIWTKRAMMDNHVMQIVMWTALFGALCWVPVAFLDLGNIHVDLAGATMMQQIKIFPKSFAMTASWVFAYYAVRELPISFAGAVRASGPLITMIGGMVLFSEYLSVAQVIGMGVCILSYYLLAVVGKKEGISALKSVPVAMMVLATALSAITTVYDKYLIVELQLRSIDIQFYSALQRAGLAMLIFAAMKFSGRIDRVLVWSWAIPLVGISWVAAEVVYFLAYTDPAAQVTQLSVFRRASLLVGFLGAVLVFREQQLPSKSVLILLLLVGMSTLILG